jgi:hypothetical protein
MEAAGAPQELIEQAKQLRAHASHRIFEFRASSVPNVDALLADLEFRLLSLAGTSTHTATGASSQLVWHMIEERLRAHPHEADPRRILSQEPLLLMGAICQYSDECKFGWGPRA